MRRAYERMMSTQGSDSLEVARTYHELARAVQSRDGLAKALPMYRESAMRLRRAGAPAADMLVAERELAERTEGLVERQAALERVLKQEGVASSSDSMVRAANLNALGISKLAVGSLHEAMILFEESLSLLDRLLPSNHINRLAVAGNLTVARRDYGDYATAERMAREILSMQTTQVTPNPLSIAAAEEGVATVVAYQGFLEEAEQRLRRALALEEANLRPTHTMIVNTMFNLGTLIATRGRPLEGARLLDSSLTLARRGGGGDLDTIATYDFKAAILLERGETAAALAMLRSIDARMREVYPPGNPFLATHSELLGVAALAASHPAEAIEHFRKASAIRRARAPETNLELTGPECGRGVALARVGRAAEARPLLRGACARYKQFGIHSRLLIRMAERLQ
jgi:tetratricopeptide (TPR) repeat protein